jgi:hypothetical protein
VSRQGVVEALKRLRSGGYRVPAAITAAASPAESEAFVETWAAELARYDDAVLDGAAREWVRGAASFPALAEFRQACRRFDERLDRAAGMLTVYAGGAGEETPPEQRLPRLRALREQIATMWNGGERGDTETPQ